MEQLTKSETDQMLKQVGEWLSYLSDRAVKDIKNAAARELTKRHPSLPIDKYGEKLQAQKRELLVRQKTGRWLK